MTPSLRLAVAQATARSGDVPGNARTVADLVDRAADGGARVVLTPELFLPGYDLAALEADPGLDLDGADDARLDAVREACRRTGTVAVVSASVSSGDRRTIAVLVVDAGGTATHAYDKQHLPADEAELFTRGRSGAVVQVGGWPLGLGVCYDGCFPEHARRLADAGALAYLVPAAYVVGAEHRRDVYYRARALDNGFYVAMAGLVGPCGDERFGGGSAVHDPEGRTCVGVPDGEQGLAFADLDREVLGATRARHTMGRDRAPDLGDVRVSTVRGRSSTSGDVTSQMSDSVTER